MWNSGLDEAQAGIKIARRNINNLRYEDDTTLLARTQEPLDEGENESEKASLKLIIQKKKKKDHGIWSLHFMASR